MEQSCVPSCVLACGRIGQRHHWCTACATVCERCSASSTSTNKPWVFSPVQSSPVQKPFHQGPSGLPNTVSWNPASWSYVQSLIENSSPERHSSPPHHTPQPSTPQPQPCILFPQPRLSSQGTSLSLVPASCMLTATPDIDRSNPRPNPHSVPVAIPLSSPRLCHGWVLDVPVRGHLAFT